MSLRNLEVLSWTRVLFWVPVVLQVASYFPDHVSFSGFPWCYRLPCLLVVVQLHLHMIGCLVVFWSLLWRFWLFSDPSSSTLASNLLGGAWLTCTMSCFMSTYIMVTITQHSYDSHGTDSFYSRQGCKS